MNPNDANAFAEQVNEQRGGERLSAASSYDLSGVADVAVDVAALSVDLSEVSVEAVGGLIEVIGSIIAGILS